MPLQTGFLVLQVELVLLQFGKGLYSTELYPLSCVFYGSAGGFGDPTYLLCDFARLVNGFASKTKALSSQVKAFTWYVESLTQRVE
jgi:hypothetical protein